MVDSNAVVIKLLSSVSAVTTLASTIVAITLPPKFDPKATGTPRAIVVNTRGGHAHPEISAIISPSVQVRCWADKPERAREVYRAVFDALHGAYMQDASPAGFIISSQEEVQGQDQIDPETGWASVVTFFTVTMRATA